MNENPAQHSTGQSSSSSPEDNICAVLVGRVKVKKRLSIVHIIPVEMPTVLQTWKENRGNELINTIFFQLFISFSHVS